MYIESRRKSLSDFGNYPLIHNPIDVAPSTYRLHIFISSYNKSQLFLYEKTITPKLKRNNKNSKFYKMQSQLNKSLLLSQIIHQRKAAAVFISSFLKSKLNKIRLMRKSLIIHLIQMRKKSCVKIQSTFRMFIVYNHFKKIFTESKFIFFYDFNSNLFAQFQNNNPYTPNQLKIKIYFSKGEQYSKTFSYSKYLNLYYIKIKPKIGVIKKKFKVNFFINKTCIVDPRYHVEAHSNGEYYNIITNKDIFRKTKKGNELIRKAEIKMRRSNSQDSSLSNTSNIMDQIFNCDTKVEKKYHSDMACMDEMKPILKKRNRNVKNLSEIRRVSFNKKVEFSY